MKKLPVKKGGRVLGSYKKVGTKFVPPMLQALRFDHVSWSSHTMPELIWWDVLADKSSLRFAATVAEEIGKHLEGQGKQIRWLAFISDYNDLSEENVDRLKEHLSRRKILDDLVDGISDFLNLYPECPLAKLLDSRPTGIVDVGYLLRFENRLREVEDKRSRDGVLMQAQAVYLGFVIGKLRVMRGLALADFPEVQHYPDTERSLTVGAAICAAVNMLAGKMLPKYQEDQWVQYFWKRSLDLHPLDFRHLETDDSTR